MMEQQTEGLKKSFGEQLRALRKNRGLTITQLAEELGNTRPYISRIERGQTNISLDIAEGIVARLGRKVTIKIE